ncbi:MAG TPA: chromate resistance protein ChrB domain-containing protein [Burkholderiales bacterium]|nr:chromate resistance protein ChrB domain-containing protein [Burkholderiales bacterium]
MQSWLVAVTQLPTEDPDARMRVLRTLESLGTAVMREGVYVLPDTPENRRALEALTEYIGKSAGNAQVLRVNAASAAQQSSLERLFDRTARYEELIKTVKSLRVGFGHSDPHAIARVLQKQRRDFEAIAALDFFPAQPRKRAEQALAKAQAEVQQLLATSSQPAVFGAAEKLQRRSWATRKPAWADRLACAWLIRRFIDPEAKVMWLEKSEPPPTGALGFAYDGAHFTANASRVAYEEMLAKLDLGRNPALAKIASIVHFLEIGGTAVPEAAGVQTLLQGALRRSSSPQELVAEAEKTFDLLYEAYYEPPGAKR